MSVIKLSKNDVKGVSVGNDKIKIKKNQLSYDSTLVNAWQTSASESFNTLKS